MAGIVVIIPARYASARFPGKLLAADTGRPLIQHTYERARGAACVERVLVATDDERIRRAVEAFGGEAVMTRVDHENGTSRIAEAVETVDASIVVNVQGDEPEIEPGLIDLAARTLERHPGARVATVASPFMPGEDPADPNIVKVVVDQRGLALYFTRALVPVAREGDGAPPAAPLKHVGLYAYRRDFLIDHPKRSPTPLERTERLEQLRWLEHGEPVAVAVGEARHHGIDTRGQYDAFVRRRGAEAAEAADATQ